jgi:hypothetical protein
MSWWIKDESGSPSVIVTLVLVSFAAATTSYVLSIVDKIGSLSIRPFDAAAAGAYFAPVLAAYVGHHFVSTRYAQPTQDSQPLPPTSGSNG